MESGENRFADTKKKLACKVSALEMEKDLRSKAIRKAEPYEWFLGGIYYEKEKMGRARQKYLRFLRCLC